MLSLWLLVIASLSVVSCVHWKADSEYLKAYAPTKGRVAKFLALEAPVHKACPDCNGKDYSDLYVFVGRCDIRKSTLVAQGVL